MRRKLKDIWLLLKSKHYAVLIGDSENEIAWAINSLRKADDLAKTGVDIRTTQESRG